MTNETYRNPGSPASFDQARLIASRFDLTEPLEVSDFPEKGNINQQAYLVKAGPCENAGEYILQMLNPNVFTQPRIVMDSMISCIQAQHKALAGGALKSGEEWETIRLVQTRHGKAFLEIEDEDGLQCWRLMTRIKNTMTYRSLRELPDLETRHRVAKEAGKGLAIFQILTAEISPSHIGYPLPGYRDTRNYYEQFLSILEENRTFKETEDHLPSDPIVRQSTEKYFLVANTSEEYHRRHEDPQVKRYLALALEQKSFALMLSDGLADGSLRKTVIHGDTKLENFLFSTETGRVKSLIDLDTIMPHTWLSDWGDMVRSLVNVAGEKEANPEKIEVDVQSFKAMAQGFLSTARHIPDKEIALMADAPQIMALELGVRFLTDYLRGDNYFKLRPEDPPDLNKTRAIVQLRLFEMLRKDESLLNRIIADLGKNPLASF